MLRIDPNTFDGLISLDALATCLQRYGVVLSDAAKRQLAARYSAPADVSAKYLSQRARVLAESRLQQAQLQDGKHKTGAIPVGSVTLGGGGGGAASGPGSPTFVQARREMLQRPVLRSVKPGQSPGGAMDRAALSSQVLLEREYDEKKIVVKTRALCDDIYLSDWTMGQKR